MWPFYLCVFRAICLYWHFWFQFNIIEFILAFSLELLITAFSKQQEIWLLFHFGIAVLFFNFMHVYNEWILVVSTLPFLPPLNTFPSHDATAWFFSSTSPFFRKKYWVQLVLPTVAWVWGHPLEHGQPTSDHIPEENVFSLSSKPFVTNSSSARFRALELLLHPC